MVLLTLSNPRGGRFFKTGTNPYSCTPDRIRLGDGNLNLRGDISYMQGVMFAPRHPGNSRRRVCFCSAVYVCIFVIMFVVIATLWENVQ